MTIDEKLFKNAMSQFAAGVTVVTTHHENTDHGMTVSSFCSVSMNPPLVLVCIGKQLQSCELIEQSNRFAVNFLAADQTEFGMRFAGMLPDIEDRFEGLEYTTATTGCPILPETLGWVDCELYQSYDGGDHTIFVGQIVAADISTKSEPLLYFNRNWGTFSSQ